MPGKILKPIPGMEEEFVTLATAREMENPQYWKRVMEAYQGLKTITKERKIGEGSEISIRPLMPVDLLGGAAQRWITAALTGNAWDQYVNVQLNSAQAVVFFGAYNRDVNPQITGFRYGAGNAGAGGVKAHFPLDQSFTEEEPVVYHTPVYYLPDEWVQTAVYDLAAVTQRFGYIGLIAEKSGEIVKGVLV